MLTVKNKDIVYEAAWLPFESLCSTVHHAGIIIFLTSFYVIYLSHSLSFQHIKTQTTSSMALREFSLIFHSKEFSFYV